MSQEELDRCRHAGFCGFSWVGSPDIALRCDALLASQAYIRTCYDDNLPDIDLKIMFLGRRLLQMCVDMV